MQQIDEMSKIIKIYGSLKKGILQISSLLKNFSTYKPRVVVNLAAQAGVRYLLQIPMLISSLILLVSTIY